MATATTQSKKYKCACCGNDYVKTSYYQSSSRWYQKYKILPVCKNCIEKIYDELFEKFEGNIDLAVYYVCANFDVFYDKSYIKVAIEQAAHKKSSIIRIYFQKINSLPQNSNYTFSDSKIDFNTDSENTDENFTLDKMESIRKSVEFDEEDEKNQHDCIRLMGYDPFAGYDKFDQKFLYGELVPYLDEDTLDDKFKLSQIIQILNNNNQIRKIDLTMNHITANSKSLVSSAADLKAMAQIKYNIVQNNDKIAKENSISVKNRGDKKAGRSTLGNMMKKYRELGFEAEQDYYDMKKAYGMKHAADVSNKSILEQLNFDEKDIDDMFKEQRELLIKVQEERDDLREQIRILKLKINELTDGDTS
jgi:hypothetical protein